METVVGDRGDEFYRAMIDAHDDEYTTPLLAFVICGALVLSIFVCAVSLVECMLAGGSSGLVFPATDASSAGHQNELVSSGTSDAGTLREEGA